jgi:DNA polymerase-3 subunit delta
MAWMVWIKVGGTGTQTTSDLRLPLVWFYSIGAIGATVAAILAALRIVATLCGQIRGWLWVSLLDQQGESDVNAIAKAAGIGNPKRIYVMRKQIRGRKPARFLALLRQLLDVEAALKRGSDPGDAFRDGFLLTT